MRVELKFYQPIVLAILFHFFRKLAISNDALIFIQQHQWQVDLSTFYNNTALAEALATIDESPAFLMMNKHAVNVTLNWLCNVVSFENVHNRLILIAFDTDSYETLKRAWPNLHVLHWKIPIMDRRFSAGDGRYQMFQLFRSNLCAYLASLGRDFWMIQSDTYWRENLFEIVDPKLMLNDDENLLFDQEGSDGLLAEMIAGGNYFIKADRRSVLFFNELSRRLLTYYSTDNNIMGGLCSYRYAGNKCSFIPYRILSNWRWHTGERKHLPLLMQFDSGAGSDAKLQQMQQLGAAFVIPETLGDNQQARCNYSISQTPQYAISKSALIGGGNNELNALQFSIRVVHELCEWLCAAFPSFRIFLRATLFPYYAYFVVL
uniref:Nucleotide-diphospho-sugar transferase domain-containing protein n=1 Tax=Parascaris univalens TaxID=6257 RepID=A0A914ZF40_PARUN